MNELLNSIKSDLLDRRLLPIVVLLGLALAGAVAYAVLAGSGSTATPAAATPSASVPGGTSRSVTLAAADPHAAVSETTEGESYQRREGAHNPFLALPSTTAKTETAPAKASAASPTSSSTSSSAPTGQTTATTPSGGGGTTPTPSPQPAPHKPKVVHRLVFHVGVLFGLAPTTPGQTSQLTPYADLKRLEPLPSTSNPLVVFEGASADRKSAIFTLAREAIVKGNATCLPSSLQCEAIELAVGQSEELQYLEENGQSVTYELSLVSIAWHETTEAKAARLNRPNHAGQALLRRLNPAVQRHLRFSSAEGVLVYVVHRGF